MQRTLGEEFAEKVMAGTPGILIKSHEHAEVLREIRAVCHSPDLMWPLATYDLERGHLVDELINGQWRTSAKFWEEAHNPETGGNVYNIKSSPPPPSPVAAVQGMLGLKAGKNPADEQPLPAILLILNSQRLLSTMPVLVQTIANRLDWGKAHNLHIVLVQPTAELPVELRRLFESGHIRHNLPDRDQIAAIINSVADPELVGEHLESVIDAAAGLTRSGVEDSVAISQVRHGDVRRDVIFEIKAESLASDNNAIELSRNGPSFDDYGGADFLKRFCKDLLLQPRTSDPKLRPKGVLLCGPPGSGKCLGRGTPVLRYDGQIVPVESVKEGDLLIGPDSRPRVVRGTMQGHGPLYRVTPVKGDPYVVNENHILSLRWSGKREGDDSVHNVSVKEYLASSRYRQERLKGWRCGVDWDYVETRIPAYVLGVWLGNGGEEGPNIYDSHEEILPELEAYAASISGVVTSRFLEDRNGYIRRIAGKAGSGGDTPNEFLNALRESSLIHNKHVPHEYFHNSRAVRLELLAGLLDTDGHLSDGCFEIVQSRHGLAEDIVRLARSVGLAAYAKTKLVQLAGWDSPRPYQRVCISGDVDMIPTRVRSKQASPRCQIKNVLRTGVTVEPIGPGDFFGFEVDQDHLFLLGDFTVTHNSFFAKCLGREVDRAVAMVTLGALKSKYQGASFENLLGLIETIEAMAPLIVFLDEIEGQVSGGKDTGSMDAGTTSQINSKLLSWMNDRTSDVFLVAACNDTRALMRDMPEFARMGRFDGLFFLDYPDRKSKDEIWKIHLLSYGLLKPDQPLGEIELPRDDSWTGSEIEACCRLARLRNVSVKQIGETMPTIAQQAKDRIDEVRSWAHGRCFAAEYEGLYDKDKHATKLAELLTPMSNGRRRKVINKPSLN